jgi:hypothetical protein
MLTVTVSIKVDSKNNIMTKELILKYNFYFSFQVSMDYTFEDTPNVPLQ